MNQICLAESSDRDEILALYKSMLHGAAGWNELYPNEETIEFDLSRNALYVMKNDQNQIVATISQDEDEDVELLPNWSPNLNPSAELARLCVRKDMQNQGIAKKMMQYMFALLKEAGYVGVHILVRPQHKVALAAYRKLGYREAGNCHIFDMDYICMELVL